VSSLSIERRDPQSRLSTDVGPASVAFEAAMAMAVARRLRPPMKVFAREVQRELGRPSLSPRTVYAWERGEARIPAAALLAASRVTATSLDDLLARAQRLHRMGLRPGE
jgi:hypothetical protein